MRFHEKVRRLMRENGLYPELAVKFNINTIPHVVVFSDGKVLYSNPGMMTKPEILEHLK